MSDLSYGILLGIAAIYVVVYLGVAAFIYVRVVLTASGRAQLRAVRPGKRVMLHLFMLAMVLIWPFMLGAK